MPYADKHSNAAIESQRKGSRKYYKNNREKEIQRCAKYNRENKERVNTNAAIRRSERMPPEKVLYYNARNRAKAKGIEFNLTIVDIILPTHCPILGIPLVVATKSAKDNSPSIDRIKPDLGYIVGNIQIISHKANTIKSNGTPEDIMKVAIYMQEHKL